MGGLVSIIMPSYNTAKFISGSIESVLAQTYSDWELIIVDDCSTDNTDEVVKPFLSDSRIKYIKNEKNSGAAVSRNRALREAKGNGLHFLTRTIFGCQINCKSRSRLCRAMVIIFPIRTTLK